MELEKELGISLFHRGKKNRKVLLTEQGIYFKRRAEEIISLTERTKAEFSASAADTAVSGDVYIGGGETAAMSIIAKAISFLQKKYPHIVVHIFSGNADDVAEKLDKGLLDFGIFVEPASKEKYHYMNLPAADIWGLLMLNNSPLAQKQYISSHDIEKIPLGWYGKSVDNLHIVADYNLIFNASLLVKEGIGYALCLDKLAAVDENSGFVFVPLKPELKASCSIVWKKHVRFTKAAETFLEELRLLLIKNKQ